MTLVLNPYSFPKPNPVTSGLKLFLDPSDSACYSRNKISFGTDIYSFTSFAGVNNGSQSRGNIVSPFGSTPLKMTVTGGDPHLGTYNTGTSSNTVAVNQGETWTVSVYVKGSINTSGELFIFGATTSGVAYGPNGFYDITAVGFPITTEWTRVSCTYTFQNIESKFLQFRFDGPNTYTSNHDIWWDGLQIEKSSSPTNFNSSTSTTLLKDLSGNNSNGTMNNSLTLSSDGKYLNFDGVDDYVSGSIPVLSGNAPHTIDSWFKLSSYGASRSWIFVLGQYGAGSHHWILSSETATQFGGWNGPQTSPTIELNKWINLVVTYDGSAVRCYKNGDLVGTTLGTLNFTSSQYNIGLRLGGESYMSGQMSTIKVYDRCLLEYEVSQNFNSIRDKYNI